MFKFAPPLHFLLLLVSGWVNREQVRVIDDLKEENTVQRILKDRALSARVRDVAFRWRVGC